MTPVVKRETIFSPDRVYRYVLWREWPDLLSTYRESYIMFIGLNPSTADETQDDPTIRKCVGFAKRWGYGALCMTNLFAYRATDPVAMKLQRYDALGLDNNRWLIECAKGAGRIIAAWGAHGGFLNRDKDVASLIAPLECLRRTKDGFPEHPLYVPYTVQPILFP